MKQVTRDTLSHCSVSELEGLYRSAFNQAACIQEQSRQCAHVLQNIQAELIARNQRSP